MDLPANSTEREAYRDEADRFYDDPARFLREEINTRERPWPRYIVGFEGIAGWLREYYESEAGMPGFQVMERWRGRNSHWHDDWRRKGDVVVWEFVDPSKLGEREAREQEEKRKREERESNMAWLHDWKLPGWEDSDVPAE